MKEKENYISPQCETLELRLEGVIAASGDLDTTFKAPFEEEEEWGIL